MKALYIFAIAACAFIFTSCGFGPNYSNHEWRKPGGSSSEKDRLLAAAEVQAIQAYPDPISNAQINSEPINAPAIRQSKRNQVIINYMASKGWKLVPKGQS